MAVNVRSSRDNIISSTNDTLTLSNWARFVLRETEAAAARSQKITHKQTPRHLPF